jgi:hypothetical protein
MILNGRIISFDGVIDKKLFEKICLDQILANAKTILATLRVRKNQAFPQSPTANSFPKNSAPTLYPKALRE